MKRPILYTLDYSASLLSAFDISGSVFLSDTLWQSKGIKHDINQLMTDLDNIEQDYKNAFENMTKDNPK